MRYVIQVSKDKAGYIAMCREFPEFVATAADLEVLSRLAIKNLSSIIASYLASSHYVPESPVTDGSKYVWHPPISLRLKIAISNGILEKGWTRDDFAEAMGLTPPSITNLFNIEISTRFSTIDKAFRVLGLYPRLEVIPMRNDLLVES